MTDRTHNAGQSIFTLWATGEAVVQSAPWYAPVLTAIAWGAFSLLARYVEARHVRPRLGRERPAPASPPAPPTPTIAPEAPDR